ncbi:phosphatase PAP2 family protein [Brevibacillus fluminis]|uniref:Phosphatase PAP2 family protein n=1 Tax=Brevibacillus fluminis TaxID=511487 RepID=A0A3M8CU07_9BACL|nr:phosphatase PAP2 family protein [Brevibacillus fluminis]RNB79204.1 phosphatase PAP2 family protein [Brevibacillus fluminis]
MHTYGDRRRLLFWAAGLFLVGALITLLVEVGSTQEIDGAVFSWAGTIHMDGLTTVLKALTYLGNGVVLAPIALVVALLFWIRGDRLEAIFLIVGVVGVEVANEGLKAVFDRPRPPGFGLIELPESASFPSGHAMVGTCFYMLAIMLISRVTALPAFLSGIVTSIIMVSVCFSRIYLGVHYASDVLTGLLLGLAWLLVTWHWYEGAVSRYRAFRSPPRIYVPRSYN